MNQTLLIRADASSKIGTGHVMRCLALAQAWQAQGGKVLFLMANSLTSLEARLQEEGCLVFHHTAPMGSELDGSETIALARRCHIQRVVVDGYHFGAAYQRQLKAAGLHLLFVDDNGHAKHYVTDWILNQNLHADKNLYVNRESYTQFLLGSQYALLRKEFWPWQDWKKTIPHVAKKILVTLGGSDPENATLKVIEALQTIAITNLEIAIVIGAGNRHRELLARVLEKAKSQISLHYNVANMPELMAWADVAVSAGGSTCWELAFMGLPSILLLLADNQKSLVTALEAEKVSICAGWHRDVSIDYLAILISQLCYDHKARVHMSATAQKLVDGKGSARVMKAFKKASILLRRAQWNDCQIVWHWANDSEARRNSFSTRSIAWSEHQVWFKAKLESPTTHLYIGLNSYQQPVGIIRYELAGKKAIVSINIDPQFRGQGYGKAILLAGTNCIVQETEVSEVIAEIKSSNKASLRIFGKAGFKLKGKVSDGQEDSITMNLSLFSCSAP